MDKLQKVMIARGAVKKRQVVPLKPDLRLIFDFSESQSGWVGDGTVGYGHTAPSQDSAYLILTNQGGGLAGWGAGKWYYNFLANGYDWVTMEPGGEITGTNLVKPPSNALHKFGVTYQGTDYPIEDSYVLAANNGAMGKKFDAILYWGENNGIGAVNKVGEVDITKIHACEVENQFISMTDVLFCIQEPDGLGSYLIGLNRFYVMNYGWDHYVEFKVVNNPGNFQTGHLEITATLISETGSQNKLRVRGTGGELDITGDGTQSANVTVGTEVTVSGTTNSWITGGTFRLWSEAGDNTGSKTQWHISKILWNDGTNHILLEDIYIP